MTTTKLLTIFEGCDGAGKTTAAKAFATLTGACYVHCGPAIGVTTDHARLYLEAMLPALLGYQDIVMDRSWISEPIYSSVYRRGKNRIIDQSLEKLVQLADHCSWAMIMVDPGWETIWYNLEKRGEVSSQAELEAVKYVHSLYQSIVQEYACIEFDYTKAKFPSQEIINRARVRNSREAYTLTELLKTAI